MHTKSREIRTNYVPLENQRYRNYSIKNDKSYQDSIPIRRKSLFGIELNDDFSDQKLSSISNSVQKSSFLPKLKSDSDPNQDLQKLLPHFKLYFDQNLNPSNFITFTSQMWQFITKNGDIYELYSNFIKEKLQPPGQLLLDFSDVSFYEKIIITLGVEITQHDQFQQFFQGFVSAYQLGLQELLLRLKMTPQNNVEYFSALGCDKSLKVEQVRTLLKNKLSQLAEQYDRLFRLSSLNPCSLWMHLRRCKQSQSYKLNFRIIRKSFALYMHETRNVQLIRNLPKFLLTAQTPFLMQSYTKPILAIDLDETLVHYDSGINKLMVRNYALEFLQNLHKSYLIVIWTASLPRYAKWALKKIDNQIDQYVDILLTREYCIPGEKGQFIKQLSSLGPDVGQIMIIENEAKNICENEKENSWIVEPFLQEDPNDTTLKDICERLLKAFPFFQEGYCLSRAIKMTYIK